MMPLSARVVPFMIAEGGSLYTCQKQTPLFSSGVSLLSGFDTSVEHPMAALGGKVGGNFVTTIRPWPSPAIATVTAVTGITPSPVS